MDLNGNSNGEIIPDESEEKPGRKATTKRTDYIDWSDYFMSLACLAAMRSKDPNTQVGACIVDKQNRIVSLGYNGMPNRISDNDERLPWARESIDPMAIKYLYVCHAEMNAIMNKNSANCEGCTLFVLMFPCCECAKLIIQSGIVRVVYLMDKHPENETYKASRLLLTMAGIKFVQFKPNQRKITIDFDKFLPSNQS